MFNMLKVLAGYHGADAFKAGMSNINKAVIWMARQNPVNELSLVWRKEPMTFKAGMSNISQLVVEITLVNELSAFAAAFVFAEHLAGRMSSYTWRAGSNQRAVRTRGSCI
jgi:hypothetical protein